MREQRDSDIRHGFSPSRFCHQSPGRSDSERNRPRLVNTRRDQQIYDKDRDFVQTNRECESFGKTRFNEPGLSEPGRFSEMGSVHRGEYSDERNGSGQKLSGSRESVLGESRKSATSLKFQWDNLLPDNKSKYRNNYPGVVVPMSMSMESGGGGGSSRSCFNHRMEMDPTESGRTYASSPLRKFEVGGRSSIVDSIVDKVEGRNDIDHGSTFWNKMMRERRLLIENHTYFGENEKDLNSRSLNFVKKRTSIVHNIEGDNNIDNGTVFRDTMMSDRRLLLEIDGSFGEIEKDLDSKNLSLLKRRTSILDKMEGNSNTDYDIAFRHNMTSERRLLLKNDASFVQDEKYLDNRSSNLVKMRMTSFVDSNKTKGNDDVDNDIAFGKNLMNKRRMLLENDISFGEDEKDLDYGSFNFMKMRRNTSIVDTIEGNKDIDNDIVFGNNMMNERRTLLVNDTSFGADEYELDRRSLNLNSENLEFVEEYGSERHGVSSGSYENELERIPIYREELFTTRSTSQLLVSPEETINMRLKRKRCFDMETSSDNQKTMLSCDWTDFDEIGDSRYGDADWTYDDIDQLSMLQNSRQGQYQGRSPEMMIDKMAFHRNAISENSLSTDLLPLEQRHSSKPLKLARIDVRRRLGPVQSVKQRLGPAPNAVKSLGPGSKVKRKLPWVTMQVGKDMEDFEQNINVQGPKSSEMKTKKYVKNEPPEDSEEFMQLVQNAFLKFVKVLNENSATRQKYMEQGGVGTLKCCICGSYKEFVDTISLAQHAFTSCKVGSRSGHLGFGKALCVLMGWDSKIVPNSRWIWQILPAAEASSQKEDLILWPPVVLIQNSSIANENLDERMLVSIEGLKDILRGMGCDRGMTNLCHGKAANRSTMVVTFSGTFSGLREAERLHKLFGEKKHGRKDFQQISFFGCKTNCQETQRVPVDKVENVLYGYMGIADDLDKLDSLTKKRCVVKSRKEIAAIADASLKSE